MIASEGGLFEIVKLLLVKVDDTCYIVPWWRLIGHCKIIELILSACAQLDLQFDKSPALRACVSNGYLDATQLLLSRGIDTPHEGGIGNDKICERILKHSTLSTWGQ